MSGNAAGHPDIRLEDVEEEYAPNPKLFRNEDDSYLQTKRIELDSIIQKVGPEAFWKYTVHQLETEFPASRDYREIVPEPKPEDYYLVSGLLQVDEKKDEIDESLRHIVQQDIASKELRESGELPQLKENKQDDKGTN